MNWQLLSANFKQIPLAFIMCSVREHVGCVITKGPELNWCPTYQAAERSTTRRKCSGQHVLGLPDQDFCVLLYFCPSISIKGRTGLAMCSCSSFIMTMTQAIRDLLVWHPTKCPISEHVIPHCGEATSFYILFPDITANKHSIYTCFIS